MVGARLDACCCTCAWSVRSWYYQQEPRQPSERCFRPLHLDEDDGAREVRSSQVLCRLPARPRPSHILLCTVRPSCMNDDWFITTIKRIRRGSAWTCSRVCTTTPVYHGCPPKITEILTGGAVVETANDKGVPEHSVVKRVSTARQDSC